MASGNPSSTLVTLCQQRGVVPACWDNAGVLTPILIHPSYGPNGLPIPAGTIGSDGATDIGLTYTDLAGTVLTGVDPFAITLGACPVATRDIEVGCVVNPSDSTAEPIPVRVEFVTDADGVTTETYVSLIDGTVITPSATAQFEPNCDRYQYVEARFCVYDATGQQVASVTRVRAYDNGDTSDGTAAIEPIAEVLLNNADGAEYTLAAGEVLGECDIVPPLITPGCLEDYTATPPTFTSAYQVVQYLNGGVPDFANATYVSQDTGAPLTKGAAVFHARACGLPCLTCV